MKIARYIFISVLVAGVFFVEYDLTRRAHFKTAATDKATAVAVSSSDPIKNTSVQKEISFNEDKNKNDKIFIEKFKKESLQISKTQDDPESTQRRMKELASVMTRRDVQAIYEIISDEKNDGDHRALAIELLSLKNDTASLTALQNFVGNNTNVNGTKWDRKKELETILRAQAVESIATYPQKEIALSTLNYLQQKVDERFLNDRIGRAAAGLYGGTPIIQQQGDDTLKKLLE